MSAPIFDVVALEYARRWNEMQILPSAAAAVRSAANTILKNKARYQSVEKATGVPWFFVGAIHYREASCLFTKHLHNGDPLAHRTVQVPAGRPLTGSPPFTWEESAIDALTMRGLKAGKVISIETFAYQGEGYNGWGYRAKGVTSPYLWAGSNEHAKGKYVADHVYDANAVDAQEGIMLILKQLMLLDASIAFSASNTAAPTPVPATPEAPKSVPAPKGPSVQPSWLTAATALASAIFKRD